MITETEADKKVMMLSDHSPFKVTYERGCSAIGWNILCQARYYDYGTSNFFNNGFGCECETTRQYQARLGLIAEQLGQTVDDIDFLALQEAPETEADHELFIQRLSNKFSFHHIVRYHNEASGVSLLSVYRSDKYDLDTELTDRMGGCQLVEGLAQRCSPIVIRNKLTNETHLLVNTHADFTKEVLPDVKTLQHKAAELEIDHLHLLGDFNRALSSIEKEYEIDTSKKDLATAPLLDALSSLEKQQCTKSSFCFKESKPILESRDGYISSKNLGKVSLEVLHGLNQPSVKLQPGFSEIFNSFSVASDVNAHFFMDQRFAEKLHSLFAGHELSPLPGR